MLKTISSIVNAIGALNYKGTWNASTNTPTLASGVGTKGDYYVVSVAGSTNLDGETLWGVGDWAVFNGSIWQKVDGGSTGNFTSVNTGTLDVTGNVTLGDASTDTVRVNGYMSVGSGVDSTIGLFIGSSALTGASQRGVVSNPVATSSATNSIVGFQTAPGTAAASFTVTELFGFRAANAIKGAGSTITNQHGLYIVDQTQGTNNYGITSLVSSGANKWNIYASGTAANYFAGDIRVGTTTQAGSSQLTAYGATNGQIAVQNSTNWSRLLQNANDLYIDNGTGGSAGNIVFRSGSGTTERMRLDASGNLGIATASPAYRLDVQAGVADFVARILNGGGSFSRQGLLLQGGNNTEFYGISSRTADASCEFGFRIRAGSLPALWTTTNHSIIFGTNDTEKMRIDTSGNLGLGVTPSAWGAGNKALEQIGGSLFSGAIGNIYLGNNTYFDGTNWIYKNTAAASYYQQGAGAHYWFQAASGTAGNTITFTERMRLDSSGNLGIGTTSAGDKVSVGGAIRVTQDGSSVGVYLAGGLRHTGSSNFYIDSNTGGAAGNIIFRNGSGFSEQMRLSSAGNLGIGTASPGYPLSVGDSTAPTGVAVVSSMISTNTASGLNVAIRKSNDGSNAAGLAFMKSRGTAASPTAVASGDVISQIQNYAYGGANYRSLTSIISTVDTYVSDTNMSSSMGFYTTNASAGPTERIRITPEGNVGVGHAAPVNKLQVVGSFGRGAPVTKTGNFTLADTENWIICNGTGTITVTLPAASSWTGREFTIKTIAAFTVISNASNVVPLAGGAAGTAILAATAGTWATLVSDGTNWIIMQA